MDWNGDGRKDLITGEYDGHVRVYLNTGTDAAPVFNGYTYLQVGGTNWFNSYTKPEVTDWNNDGRFDIVCGNSVGNVLLILNTGTATAPSFSSVTFIYNGASKLAAYGSGRACPVVVDWNRDGKKDLIVGNLYGELEYYENKGTDAAPVFNGSTRLYAGGEKICVGYYAAPEVVDWDNDGWQDLIVGSDENLENSSDGHVFYFHSLSGPYLKTSEIVEAKADGFLERGEECRVFAVLTNTGGFATGVVATLSTTNRWCTLVMSNWAIGDFNPQKGTNNIVQPFRFSIATNAPFGTPINFDLTISGNGGSYRQVHLLSCEVAKPEFGISSVLVSDSSGNCNCACNSGETVQLLLRLTNSGYRADAVVGRLTSVSPDVVLLNSNSSFGTIERNMSEVCWQTPFAFSIPTWCPSNAIYRFNLNLSYQDGSQPTNIPVAIGEYVVKSDAEYSWLDLTGGTTVALTDESYRTVSLGFPFSFYGARATNYVHLVSNGYLMFASPYSSYNVTSIPNVSVPNFFIAPWWEDLNPGAGGTIRYRTFGTTPNRYWAVEFANVPRYGYSTQVRSFQAILYENGDIKFQYGACDGTPYSRTIGLENVDGTLGKAWTQSVGYGTALLFTQGSGTGDNDKDGIPDPWESFYFGGTDYSGEADTDGDGFCNLDEWKLGFDPIKSGSRFVVQDFQLIPGAKAVVRWRSIPGKSYSIWTSGIAGPLNWTRLNSAPISGHSSGVTSYTNSLGSAPCLFRVSSP